MRQDLDSELVQNVLDEIPLEYRDRFHQILSDDLPDAATLKTQMDAYIGMVRKVAAWVTALDPDAADRIAKTCSALLDRYADTANGTLVRAVVQYFIEEDEDDEITGVLGFDDDIQVVNAACRVLGAEDLLLPLIR